MKICEWFTKTLTLIYKVYSHTIHIWLELPASSLIWSFRLGVWAISRNLWINQDIFDILMLEKNYYCVNLNIRLNHMFSNIIKASRKQTLDIQG